MLRREARPGPTRVSPYFFEHLSQRTASPSLEAGSQAALPAQPPSSSTPQVCNQSEDHPPTTAASPSTVDGHSDAAAPSPVLPSSAVPPEAAEADVTRRAPWQPALVTGLRDVDATLWNHFTPHDYRHTVEQFVSTEHERTTQLSSRVDEMWAEVERVIQRNTVRHRALTALQSPTATEAVGEGDTATPMPSPPPPPPLLAVVHQMVFWTAEEMVRRYGLDLPVARDRSRSGSTNRKKRVKRGDGDAQVVQPEVASGDDEIAEDDAEDEGRITLDFTVQMPSITAGHATGEAGEVTNEKNTAAGSETEDKAAATTADHPPSPHTAGMHHANAWQLRREDLLHPSRRPQCLRRLFAPLLQRRASLPRELTLLLNDLQRVQSKALPQLEEGLAQSSPYAIALHVPFQTIATFFTRYLAQESATVQLEATQVEAHTADTVTSAALELFLSQALLNEPVVAEPPPRSVIVVEEDGVPEEEPVPLELMDLPERAALAEHMWQLLFAQLQAHKEGVTDGLRAYAALTDCSRSSSETLSAALKTCNASSQAVLARMTTDTTTCAEAMTKAGSHTLAIVDEMDRNFATDSAALERSIEKKVVAVEKSAHTQEKLARRVREAVRDLFVEQRKYEELTQELWQERLALEQLRSSYEQVRQAIHTCHEEAVHAEQRAREVRGLLQRAEEARQSLMDAAELHLGRVKHDDYFRRCRVLDIATRAAQRWSHCLDDISYLYSERSAFLERKEPHTSWSLNYLLTAEREWAVANLRAVKEECAELDARLGELSALRTELGMDPRAGLEEDQTPTSTGLSDDERRRRMRRVDGPLRVQRLTTSLSALRARGPEASTAATRSRIERAGGQPSTFKAVGETVEEKTRHDEGGSTLTAVHKVRVGLGGAGSGHRVAETYPKAAATEEKRCGVYAADDARRSVAADAD